MKVVEYIAEILPNGSLALPDDIHKELGSQKHVKARLTVKTPATPNLQKGWQIFKNLGKDAVAGKLSNTSKKHDEYLYGIRK
ncbi:MAG: hypothetical protein OXP71_03325 [Candidatus Poribacteria bacterium]|nr:hypothetical protein [Candidatus Poribacteria bacterium]